MLEEIRQWLMMQPSEIHAVELVAAQDQRVIEIHISEVDEVLPHGIRGALVPRGVGVALLCRQDLDKAAAEMVELERPVHVPVEGGGEKLREEKNPPHLRVDAVGDGDVHQAVLPCQGHSGLGAFAGEREQPDSLTATHDDGQDLMWIGRTGLGGRHGRSPQLHDLDRKRASRSIAGSRIVRSAA
jgi:hypothetical protein